MLESVDMTDLKDGLNDVQLGLIGSGLRTRASQPLTSSSTLTVFPSLFSTLLYALKHPRMGPANGSMQMPNGCTSTTRCRNRVSDSEQWPRRKPTFRARQQVCLS
jgi:hypothetical protein